MCSYLLGSCFSTSIFNLLNKKGRNTFNIKQFYKMMKLKQKYEKSNVLTLCNRLIIFSLYSEFPSIIPVNGFENHSLNSR